MSITTFLILALLLYVVIILITHQAGEILSNWHHLFDGMQFSPQEFYQVVELLIKEKQLRQVAVGRITYPEAGLFSAKREYLRVKYKEYVFDICAAPFAKDIFVSWWLMELKANDLSYLRRIPIIGLFMRKRKKTYFELDTENMFKECIRDCVNVAVSQMSEAKGFRKLSDVDFKSITRPAMYQQ